MEITEIWSIMIKEYWFEWKKIIRANTGENFEIFGLKISSLFLFYVFFFKGQTFEKCASHNSGTILIHVSHPNVCLSGDIGH